MHGRPATDLHSGPTLEVAVEMKCKGTTLQGQISIPHTSAPRCCARIWPGYTGSRTICHFRHTHALQRAPGSDRSKTPVIMLVRRRLEAEV